MTEITHEPIEMDRYPTLSNPERFQDTVLFEDWVKHQEGLNPVLNRDLVGISKVVIPKLLDRIVDEASSPNNDWPRIKFKKNGHPEPRVLTPEFHVPNIGYNQQSNIVDIPAIDGDPELNSRLILFLPNGDLGVWACIEKVRHDKESQDIYRGQEIHYWPHQAQREMGLSIRNPDGNLYHPIEVEKNVAVQNHAMRTLATAVVSLCAEYQR